MRLENGKLQLGERACWSCEGTCLAPTRSVECETCHGTGRGKRGGAKACRGGCHGLGTRWVKDGVMPPCRECTGTATPGRQAETWADSVPREVFLSLPIRVEYVDRSATWNEAHFGLGCLFSCVDYGRAWQERDDAALIGRVHAERSVAASSISKDGVLCAEVVIVVTRDGWSPRARYAEVA